MNRLTSNDKNWGPFTIGKWHKTISARLCSGGYDESKPRSHILLIGFGWALRIVIPNIIKPWLEKCKSCLKPGDFYHQTHEREFGFSLSDMGNGYDFIQVFFGARTNSSDTDMVWCTHLPWKQWRHVRKSLYDENGNHWQTEPRKEDFRISMKREEDCPKRHFGFEDYDGEMIVATTHIEEREWKRGTGWFKWLSLFYPNKVRRSLDLRFNKEVGPEKGSWKGGTVGHGIDMLKGETHEQAFRRYCDKDHERKGGKFRLRFIGPCKAPPTPEKQPAMFDCGSVQAT